MKIKKLKIEGYKNLNINLKHNSDIVAIIGNNGSGKSNLLESISYIFKSLYTGEPQNLSFNYYIEYSNSNNEVISIGKEKAKVTFQKDGETLISIADYLPKKLIAIYSGEEDRLWKTCYEPYYDNFIRDINKTKADGLQHVLAPQMLYLNKYYWHISLLCLALSDLEDNQRFVKEKLGINSIDKVAFTFDKGSYKNYSNSPTLSFIQKIDQKSEYTIEELKGIFEEEGYIPDDVYKHLYLAFTPKQSKIIKDITLKINEHLTIEDLSEGEKKLLLIKAAFEFAEQEDSLFILDEPDAHVHLNNKEQVVKTFDPYKANRQIIITTHSPTITQSISEDELFMVDKGQIVDKRKQDIINDLTGEFWNKHQQSSFLSSSKKLILLVEGKHDKTHINNAFSKLKDEYPELDFDIYSLGGESKIYPFMNGLYEANIKNDVLYIGIYDNDEAGKGTLNKAGFEKEIDKCGYRKMKGDKIDHNHFFGCLLPKPDEFNSDCTIENMYEPEKYELAYRQALKSYLGNFKNKSIVGINKDIKDASKNILSDNSKGFEKDDFKSFNALFSIITTIYKNGITSNVIDSTSEAIEAISLSVQVPADRECINEKQVEQKFFMNIDGLKAEAFYKYNTEFKLLATSQISKTYKGATKEIYKKQREKILSSLKHRVMDNYIIIQEDYSFESPSGAAKFVVGGNKNGWNVWKDKDGKTLDQLYRK